MFNDIYFSTEKSHSGNTCAQIYAIGFGWSRCYPIEKKADAHKTLNEFFHCVRVPEHLISDAAPELTKGEFGWKARKAQCSIDPVNPHSPWMNRAESEI